MMVSKCRICGSKEVVCLGSLPNQQYFAGNKLSFKMGKSELLECNSCFALSREPILPPQLYNQLYAKAESTVWASLDVDLRKDQKVIRQVILKMYMHGCKVLDVGCYTGNLLASLPNTFDKYGVEISKAARMVAIEKRIEVVGEDLYHLDQHQKFDLIVAVDVIEHTENPEIFLKKLGSLLDVNGHILISTGNTDNWLWRLLKNRFWYTSFAEHISFIGDKWLVRFCRENNFVVVDKKNFNYSSFSLNVLFKIPLKLILSLVGFSSERFSNVTKDHFFFVIRKQS